MNSYTHFCAVIAPAALAATFLLAPTLRAVDPPSGFPSEVRPFLGSYCVGCHNAQLKKGGLDLEALPNDFGEPTAFAAWVKVFDRLRLGEMPPKSVKRQPPRAESTQVLKSLEAGLVIADRTREEREGRAVLRRLNRAEYENTLRDLFSLPHLNVRDLLPEDGRAFGYDKCGAGLELSHVQLAKYLEAADAALDLAIAPYKSRPETRRRRIYLGEDLGFQQWIMKGNGVCLRDQRYDDSLFPVLHQKLPQALQREVAKKFPYVGSVGLLGEDVRRHPRPPVFVASYPGRYRFRVSLWSFQWDRGEVRPALKPETACLLNADDRAIGYFDAPSLQPAVHEVEAWLNAREYVQFGLASLWPVVVSELKGRVAEFVGPGIAVDWVEVEGPLYDAWPPASHARLFGDLPLIPLKKLSDTRPPERRVPPLPQPQNADYTGNAFATVSERRPESDARRLLGDFLGRAFRRPVEPDELARYVDVVNRILNKPRRAHYERRMVDGRKTVVAVYDEQKTCFEDAMRAAYRTALCSPDFLFLKESPGRLDGWALASRLSYLLWQSLPDDELFTLADNGRLHDPIVLGEQAERMLKDPRSERFVCDFLDQWLDLRDIDDTTPDSALYPEFNSYLRDSMLGESRKFFRELLDGDLPAANVVASDFAMLNQKMAEHYHIGGVTGTAFRKVLMAAENHRGGFLTQASVLKVTANGTTTSPVRRGAWVLRKIVGRPPDPPPPDLPVVEPDLRGTITVREQLDKHRSQPSCAACHAEIDPPGFALENFDVIGGWRDRFRSLGQGDIPRRKNFARYAYVRYRLASPVDASGKISSGQQFSGIDDFRTILLEDERQVARNLLVQLLTYATGAPPAFADRAEVEAILDRAARANYGVRSLVLGVIQSPLFRIK